MHPQEGPFPGDLFGVVRLIAESLSPAARSAQRPGPIRAKGEAMNDHSAHMARAFRYPSIRRLVPEALCVRAGFVGLIAAGGGIAALAHGTSSAGAALAWLAVGAAMVAYSLHRLVSGTATPTPAETTYWLGQCRMSTR
jgi:hypothetical protein